MFALRVGSRRIAVTKNLEQGADRRGIELTEAI
jgi:hypothetical protein